MLIQWFPIKDSADTGSLREMALAIRRQTDLLAGKVKPKPFFGCSFRLGLNPESLKEAVFISFFKPNWTPFDKCFHDGPVSVQSLSRVIDSDEVAAFRKMFISGLKPGQRYTQTVVVIRESGQNRNRYTDQIFLEHTGTPVSNFT